MDLREVKNPTYIIVSPSYQRQPRQTVLCTIRCRTSSRREDINPLFITFPVFCIAQEFQRFVIVVILKVVTIVLVIYLTSIPIRASTPILNEWYHMQGNPKSDYVTEVKWHHPHVNMPEGNTVFILALNKQRVLIEQQ